MRPAFGVRHCGLSGAIVLIATTVLHAADAPLELTVGPLIRHLAPQHVVVQWETSHAAELVLSFGREGGAAKQVDISTPGHDGVYSVALDHLEPSRAYRLQIKRRPGDEGGRTLAECTFDTDCDQRPCPVPDSASPYPADAWTATCAKAAQQIVEGSGIRQGYCLVLGCGDGRLALELARQSDMQIIGLEEDAALLDAARRTLDKAGVYGLRVTMHQGKGEKLPYAAGLFNLVVSARTLQTGELPPAPAEVFRVVRPSGGVFWLELPPRAIKRIDPWINPPPGWTVARRPASSILLRRGPLPGSGEWTHLYGEPGNSACSGDPFRLPVALQWFGRPGPRMIVDRHNRPMAPLVKNGQLFVLGSDRVKAVDAYNGTPLWEWTIPGSRRTVISRDCGQAVLADDLLYVAARDRCLAFDVATGDRVHTLALPQLDPQKPRVWGYLACVGNTLLGGATRAGASFREINTDSWKSGYFDAQPHVVSDWLFCLDRHSGKLLWKHHDPEGIAIPNTAIAAGDGRVCFLESRNRPAVTGHAGRLRLEVLLAKGQCRLVALDQATGKQAWEREVDLSVRNAAYLSYARGTLVVSGSVNEGRHPRYDIRAFSAKDGGDRWSSHFMRPTKVGGSHGEQEQHPAIVGGTVYFRFGALELETGKVVPLKSPAEGGCGTLSASAHYLFGRQGNPYLYMTEQSGKGVPLTTVTRPGCWINMIAAGGILLIPEGSSGCTCPFPVQTSLGIAPKRLSE